MPRPKPFQPLSNKPIEEEDDGIEIIRDRYHDDYEEDEEEDDFYEDTEITDEMRKELGLVSASCCWGAAIVALIIGVVCVVVVGTVKRKDLTGDAQEIRDITLILAGLGIGPGIVFFLLCLIGCCICVRQRQGGSGRLRVKSYRYEMDELEDDESINGDQDDDQLVEDI